MMESVTVGEILTAVGVMGALIAAAVGIYKYFKKAVEKVLEEQFQSINKQFKSINERLDEIDKMIMQKDIDACKDFIVRFLSDVERGADISEMETQRFSERYNQYINKYQQNGYIQDKVNKLKEKGLL